MAIVPDRFYEPEDTRPIDDKFDEYYDNYLENFEGEEGEKPLSREAWEDMILCRF